MVIGREISNLALDLESGYKTMIYTKETTEIFLYKIDVYTLNYLCWNMCFCIYIDFYK